MERNGEVASTPLPAKFLLPSSLVKISLAPALDYLVNGLGFMIDDYESITSIFAMLVQEAMGYGEEFGDIENAVDYALRHPRCPDRGQVYQICANTSESIYSLITTYLPDFGMPQYSKGYTFTLGENGNVYIRLSNSISSIGTSSI